MTEHLMLTVEAEGALRWFAHGVIRSLDDELIIKATINDENLFRICTLICDPPHCTERGCFLFRSPNFAPDVFSR